MRYLKTFENHGKLFTGDEVSDYIINITPEESDIPDYFISEYVRPNNFILTRVSISDLVKSDPSFAEYLNYGEDRYSSDYDYGDDYPNNDELYDPVVVVDGTVMDGYNRMTVLHSMGEDMVDAYVNK